MDNSLRDKLNRGQVTFGITSSLNPIVTEALGNVGLDWIAVDMQHTPLDFVDVEQMFQAMSYSHCVPIVRIVSNDLGYINRALDIGAYAVIVPLVNSREDTEKAVRAAKYPPEGLRSSGPRRPGLRDPNYFSKANAEVMVIPQIETELAVKNVEDIVTTDGIDAVFVGPVDLSISLGVYRQFDSPMFLRAEETIMSACKAHNVAAGLLAPTGHLEKSIRQGYKLISLGGDLPLLTQSVANALKNAKNVTSTSSA